MPCRLGRMQWRFPSGVALLPHQQCNYPNLHQHRSSCHSATGARNKEIVANATDGPGSLLVLRVLGWPPNGCYDQIAQ
jgi:hypothetical protein